MPRRFAVASAVLGFVVGCASPSSGPDLDLRELPATISLVVGQYRTVGGSIVRFDEVRSDSRCPSDVQCAWAGNAEIVISVGPVAEVRPNQTVVLNTYQPETVSAGGLRISLVTLDPTPISTAATRNYRVAIRLESAPQT